MARFSLTRLLGDPTMEDSKEITSASVSAIPTDEADEQIRVVLAQIGITQPPLQDEHTVAAAEGTATEVAADPA